MRMEGLQPGESMRSPSHQEQAFMDRLALHNSRLSGVMPDLASQLDHGGHVASEQLAQKFDNTNFSADVLAPFKDHGEKGPAELSFMRKPFLELGHEQSYHGTFLGEMRMASSDGAVVDTRLVAVKPFLLNEGGSLAQEVAMLQFATSKGLQTVKPLAVIADRWGEVQRFYLITERLDPLSTLAAENWLGIQANEVAERLQPARKMLLDLHERGMTHGDPQFKNVATGESEGEIIVHDLEEATSIQALLEQTGPDDEIPEKLVMALRQEFYRVRLSMRDYVYPNLPEDQRPNSPEERFMFELGALFEPYHLALGESASPYRQVLDRAYKIMLERTRREVSEGYEPQPGDVPSSTARS